MEDKEGKASIIERLKKIKHIDIIIALVVLAIVLLIYFGAIAKPSKKVETIDSDNREFLRELEDTISSIDGVGKAKVVINYDKDKIVEIARKETIVKKVGKDGESEVIETLSEPVIIRGGGEDKPIVIKESRDLISGVMVVCKGGNDVKVKLSIIDAISTLLDIDRDMVKVYPMR